MIVTPTLSRYLARTYTAHLLAALGFLLTVVYVFETVELIRRANKTADVPLAMVLQMSLLKMPGTVQVLLPFAVLFSALFMFWQLTRRYELVTMRAAGFSAWQFCTPLIFVAALAGIIHTTVLNPLGSLMLQNYERLESRYLRREENQVAIFAGGLWLRQPVPDGYVILHAPRIALPAWSLEQPTALFFAEDDTYLRRIDARKAALEGGYWVFSDVRVNTRKVTDGLPSRESEPFFRLPTELTRGKVEESFSSPAVMSFWRLPGHIATLAKTGFDPARLSIHYHALLAQPLLFVAMVLIAAAFAMRPPRTQAVVVLIGAGVLCGFAVFFFANFLQALGATHQVPVVLAAWAPAVVVALLGASAILTLEDG